VKDSFHPFVIGFILCAVLAATINAMSSQVLVLSSSLTEDFYKRIFRKTASPKELLVVSRLGVVIVALFAFFIAYGKISTIYSLVLYAWSGLGASFGPLLLLSLYSKNINKFGAWTGIVLGGGIAAVWPYFNKNLSTDIPNIVPAFIISFISIIVVSKLTHSPIEEIEDRS
jgi:Na+/proline symporter